MEDRHAIATRCTDMARRHVEGRKVIVSGALLAPATPWIRGLRELGAGPFLIVATGVGTGELPGEDEADWVVHEVDAVDTIDEFRQVERLLADPPPEIVDAVERFDPDRDACLVYPPFSTAEGLCGRPAYGARRPEWIALEDKTTCDRLFDAVGVRRPPNEVVGVDRDALLAAAARLDQGAGTVWSGDALDGFNGGGIFVRWIEAGADEAVVDEAIARFQQCDLVRVAPFIEGIPCSIHGIVCPDGVAALRPVEMVNLRRPGAAELQYAGAATFYDPPDAVREEMRDAVRKLGTLLADEHGFRATFTADGIVGADGWVPTELNPRFGAGIGYFGALYPTVPAPLIHQMLVAGDADLSAAEVEALLIPAADDVRWGGGWSMIPTKITENDSVRVRFEGDVLLVAGEEEISDGELLCGPNAVGGYVRLNLHPERIPKGPSIAPRVAAALRLADDLWNAGIGPLEAPKDVR